jgi:hypothetical protein
LNGFVDPELYDKPVFNYQSKPENPRDAFGKTERKAVCYLCPRAYFDIYNKEP